MPKESTSYSSEAVPEEEQDSGRDMVWNLATLRQNLVGEFERDGHWRIIAWRDRGALADIYDVYGKPRGESGNEKTYAMKLWKTDAESLEAANREIDIYTEHLRKPKSPTHFLKFHAAGIMEELKFQITGLVAAGYRRVNDEDEHQILSGLQNDPDKLEDIQTVPCIITEKVFFTIATIRAMAPPPRARGFPTGFALRLGLGCLRSIKAFHDLGFVHRHITPGNMGLRLTADKKFPYDVQSAVVLVNFGASKPWPGEEPQPVVTFFGTSRYSSINAHHFKEQGPVDDLWSLFYMMVELCSDGEGLPWKDDVDIVRVKGLKEKATLEELCKSCPGVSLELQEIGRMLEPVSAYEYPPVEKIEKILEKAARKEVGHPGWIRFTSKK